MPLVQRRFSIFSTLHHPNNRFENISIFIFSSSTQWPLHSKKFLGGKNFGGVFATPLRPPSYASDLGDFKYFFKTLHTIVRYMHFSGPQTLSIFELNH